MGFALAWNASRARIRPVKVRKGMTVSMSSDEKRQADIFHSRRDVMQR
jgi:hypothetical protein